MKSRISLEKLFDSIDEKGFEYPAEKIALYKDNETLYSNVDDILMFIFGLSNFDTNEKYIKILRNMTLIPYSGIDKYEFKEMLNLETLDDVNFLIESSVIQENATTGYISLHQIISDLCRKTYKPDCENCPELLEYFTKRANDTDINSSKKYNEFITIFNFIENIITENRNLKYKYYQLETAKLMTVFNDFNPAKKMFEIFKNEEDDYCKYCSYQYLLAIEVDSGSITKSKELLKVLEDFEDIEKYPDILWGVPDNKGWIYLNYNDDPNLSNEKKEEYLQKAIDLYEAVLEKGIYENIKLCSIADRKINHIRYSLSLAYYKIAEYKTNKLYFYEKAEDLIHYNINKQKGIGKEDTNVTFHEYNVLGSCYYKTGKYKESRNTHRALLDRKLNFHPETTHTIVTTYRNLIVAENEIFQRGLENNLEDLKFDLAKLDELSKSLKIYSFNATAYDMWIKLYLKTRDYAKLLEKLTELYNIIHKKSDGFVKYKYTYFKFSKSVIEPIITSFNSIEIDENLKANIIDVFDKLEKEI